MKTKEKSYLFLAVLIFFVVWCLVGRFGLFASNGDWLSQHSVIPDYFRQQFYATGQIFPEFAAGLGAGCNIYDFSYYGLLSPILLPSYLMPFLKMSDYLMAASFLCLASSVFLMHYWLGTHGHSMSVRLIVSVMFLLAAPMIYQFHRQIMFVNYMPFLCLAFIGADRYWKKGKPGLYMAGVFLMIMTSFYFSIGGLLALFFYVAGRSERDGNKSRMFRFVLPTAAAVCLAGVLLVPTAYALFARSGGSGVKFSAALWIPDFSITRFAYSGYGIGLSAGILPVLVLCLLCKNLRERFLAAGCVLVMTVPFFSWILNGGLYARGKSLIPFLPVLCYLTAVCLEGMKKREISLNKCRMGYLAAVLFCVCCFFVQRGGEPEACYVGMTAEFLLLPICFLIFRKTGFSVLVAAPSVLSLALCAAFLNAEESDRLDAEFYQDVTDASWGREISNALNQEKGLFRLEQSGNHEEKKANINRVWDARQWSVSAYSSAYHEGYKNFRENVFLTEQPLRNELMLSVSENPLFQKFMGIKYLAKKDKEDSGVSVCRQEHAAPVIYATDQVITEDAYQEMAFPCNQTALMRYAVTKSAGKSEKKQTLSSLPDVWKANIRIAEDSAVHKTQDGYFIQSKKETKKKLYITGQEADFDKEQIFFLQFDVKNSKKNQDVIIELAGVRNNLSARNHVYYNGNTTFTYVFRLEKGQKDADILFRAGKYSISNIRGYLSDASLLREDSLYQSAFVPDWSKTRGNQIYGKLDVSCDGYLITSIPFDTGFEIWIDGRRCEKEIVNTAFLGTKISKGKHRIALVYHAPFAWHGKLVSVLGAILLSVVIVLEKKKNSVHVVSFHYNFLTSLMYNKKEVKAANRR